MKRDERFALGLVTLVTAYLLFIHRIETGPLVFEAMFALPMSTFGLYLMFSKVKP